MEKMEKMKDFLYKLAASAEVSHDHLEDWFDEKSSVTNTLSKLTNKGKRVMELIEEKKDKEIIINEMMKFFRDAYFETEAILVLLTDTKNEMTDTARYWFWDIKKTALLAILACGYEIASPKEETVNKK